MKIKLELASNELKDFVVSFMKKHYGVEINCVENNVDIDPEKFVKFVGTNYDKVNKILYDMPIDTRYYESTPWDGGKIDKEKMDVIITSYVREKFNLQSTSVRYAMVVHDHCVSQVEFPHTARRVDGKIIAECEIDTIDKVQLNFV